MRTITIRPKASGTTHAPTRLKDLPTTDGAVAVIHKAYEPPDFSKPIVDAGPGEAHPRVVKCHAGGWFYLATGVKVVDTLNEPATLVPDDCEVVL